MFTGEVAMTQVRFPKAIVSALLVTSVALGLHTTGWAKQEIIVSDDAPIRVDIAQSHLTLVKLPFAVNPNGIITVSPTLEVRASGKNVAIDPRGTKELADLVVMTEEQSYVFQLRPMPIAAEMVVIVDTRASASGRKAEQEQLKRAEGYIDANVDLVTQAARGSLPKSCLRREVPRTSYPAWLELEVWEAIDYICQVYTVTYYRVHNKSREVHSLRQTEFFTGEQLSISLNRHILKPGDDAEVFLVTYSKPVHLVQDKPVPADPEAANRK